MWPPSFLKNAFYKVSKNVHVVVQLYNNQPSKYVGNATVKYSIKIHFKISVTFTKYILIKRRSCTKHKPQVQSLRVLLFLQSLLDLKISGHLTRRNIWREKVNTDCVTLLYKWYYEQDPSQWKHAKTTIWLICQNHAYYNDTSGLRNRYLTYRENNNFVASFKYIEPGQARLTNILVLALFY